MNKLRSAQKNVFIVGASSDIGMTLAESYSRDGYSVTGTYRNKSSISALALSPGIHMLKCDITRKTSVKGCLNKYKSLGRPWDIFISCVGSMAPIGGFFENDFDKWEQSIVINSLAQLRFLHALYPFRHKNKVCHVVFFAGGGTNNPFTNYSAYCVSKIMMIKMCELLDDENKDLNVFIVGPGWVRTKIHAQTLASRSRAGSSYKKTLEFLRSNDPGTNCRDIYDCINWCVAQGAKVAGGRNFSVVHDNWRKSGEALKRQLLADRDKFKLRRYKNS